MVIKIPYRKISIFISSFLVVLFIAHQTAFFSSSFIERYTSYLVCPLLSVQHSITVSIQSYFANKKNVIQLQEQLQQLQQERDQVIAQNIELHGLINFEQDTKEITDFKQRYHCDTSVLAQVLLKNFSDQSHFFLIDKGTRANIHPDMVVVYKDCLIGRVIESYPYYSKVLLVSDALCKVAAYCVQSKATGIYQGTNQEWLAQLNHVSHLSQPEVGEIILSSGDGLIFPKGFGLGKIKEFKTEGLFHTISVEPLADLHAIEYCYVLQKGDSYLEDSAPVEIV